MKPIRKKYQLSNETLDSVLNQTDSNAELDLNRNGKKGNTFILINEENGELQFIIPYKHRDVFYAAHLPNPTHLLFKQAIEHKTIAEEITESFSKNIEFVYEQNPTSKSKINMVNPEIFDRFIIYKISCLTSLISSVEAFINEIIPDDFTIFNNRNIEVGKHDIERFWNLKSKLKEIVPKIITSENSKYTTLVDKLLEVNNLRNEFIHLKSKKDNRNFDPYLDYFQELINLNLDKTIIDTKNLINTIKPSYL